MKQEQMLNNITTCLINLPLATERFKISMEELKSFGIEEVVYIEGVLEKDGMVGVAKAHLKCIQFAKDQNLPYVLIVEDDIHFPSPLAREHADAYLNNLPTDWNILLGGLYTSAGMNSVNESWNQTKEFSGTHFYIVNSNCYDHILSNYDFKSHIDRWYARSMASTSATSGKLKCFVPKTFFAIQHDGYSFNSKQVTNYSKLLKKYKVLK